MEKITVGEITAVVSGIVVFIGGVEFIVARLNKLLDKKLEPIKNELKENTIQSIKNHLVNYLSLAEQDLLIGKQKENFYELYDVYTNKYKCNSYIHTEYEKLHELGKI